MELKELISLADIKERQAKAYAEYYLSKNDSKIAIDDFQESLDNYCKQMAISFVSKHRQIIEDCLLIPFKRYISSLQADHLHSGYRFYEALYLELNEFDQHKTKSSNENTL